MDDRDAMDERVDEIGPVTAPESATTSIHHDIHSTPVTTVQSHGPSHEQSRAGDEFDDAFDHPLDGSYSATGASPASIEDPWASADDDEFEHGLLAPEWPDTSDLIARFNTPRTTTPVSVDITPDVALAFGREPQDEIVAFEQSQAVEASSTHDISNALDLPLSPSLNPMDPAREYSDDATVEAHRDEWTDDDALDDIPEGDDALDDEWRTDESPSAGALPWLATGENIRDRVSTADIDVADDMPTAETSFAEILSNDSAEDQVDADDFSGASADAAMESHAEASMDAHAETSMDAHAEADAVGAEPSVVAAATPAFTPAFTPVFTPTLTAPVMHSAMDSAPAFVTETMGELLVSQGFTSRAVNVYEELVRRRPYDPVLTSRLAELREHLAVEQSAEVDAAPSTHYATPQSVTPQSVTPQYVTPQSVTPQYVTPQYATPQYSTPQRTTPLRQTPVLASSAMRAFAPGDDGTETQLTARELFARIAARRVPRRTPPQGVPSIAVDQSEGLAILFGGSATNHDDSAARALADAFAPIAPHDMVTASTLDLDFGRAPSLGTAPLATPASVLSFATPVGSTATPPGNAGFSFDRFFPDPATQASASSAPSVPTAPDAGAASSPSKPTEDLAQFSAWLKGLGNR